MSNYENITTNSRKMKDFEVAKKSDSKLRKLEKEMERRNRTPSNRLGKNAKKQAARLENILKVEDIEIVDDEVVTVMEIPGSIKMPRIPLSRQKRKPSHRERRPETENF
jgi:hypothetical protein